jgi:hypothetical protein
LYFITDSRKNGAVYSFLTGRKGKVLSAIPEGGFYCRMDDSLFYKNNTESAFAGWFYWIYHRRVIHLQQVKA